MKIYHTPQWRKLRRQVLVRDQYTCKFCGCSVRGRGMSRVDHIIPVKERPDLAFDPYNLRVLCPPCDNKRHFEKFPNHKEKVPISADGSPEGESWT